jgi:hypothetical protein
MKRHWKVYWQGRTKSFARHEEAFDAARKIADETGQDVLVVLDSGYKRAKFTVSPRKERNV